MDAANTLKEKIKAFALSRLENSDAKREFFKIMDTEPGTLSFARMQYRNWLREPVERLASAIQNASQKGEIRNVAAEPVARAVADMTRGITQRRLVGGTDTTPGEDADFLVDFAWTALDDKEIGMGGRKLPKTMTRSGSSGSRFEVTRSCFERRYRNSS